MCSETTLEGSGGFKLPSLQSVGLGMTLRELLEQAIRLRSSGQAQQSLELLERAKAQGVTNGWVDDNRARALVKLDRLEEARDLWRGLEAGAAAHGGGGARHGSAAVLEATALLRRESGRRTRPHLTRRAERVAQGGTRGSGPRPRTPRRRTGGRTAQEPPKPRLDPPDRHEGLSLP